MLRITVNGCRAEISVKRKIDPERWDSSANRVNGNKDDALEINALIDKLMLRLNKIFARLVEEDDVVTADKIKQIFQGKATLSKTLLEAFDHHNQMMKSRVGIDFRHPLTHGTRPHTTTLRIFFFTSILNLTYSFNRPDILSLPIFNTIWK